MKTIIIIAMLFCAGCGGLAGEPIHGWKSMQETVTTKQDVLARHGNPTYVWNYSDGRSVVWIYDLGATREARFAFIGDLLSEKHLFYRGERVAYIGGLVDW